MYVTSKSGPTIGKEAILAFIPLLMRFDEVENNSLTQILCGIDTAKLRLFSLFAACRISS